jgi:hypothetical protein
MKVRINEAEAEAKKFETLFYNVRRAFERERTEHALFKEQVRAAIESDRAVFEAELAEMHANVERMRMEAMRMNLDEALNQAEDSLQKVQKHTYTHTHTRAHFKRLLNRRRGYLKGEMFQHTLYDAFIIHHQ